LTGVAFTYLWRNLIEPHGFAQRQRVGEFVAPFAMRQHPCRHLSSDALVAGSIDTTVAFGFCPYLPDDVLARHIGHHLGLLKPGGRIIFDDTRETPGVGDIITLVMGWDRMQNRNLERLNDKVLMPNAAQIQSVESYNIDNVFRVVVLHKVA